jgi:hypothetical protein
MHENMFPTQLAGMVFPLPPRPRPSYYVRKGTLFLGGEGEGLGR